MFHLQLKNRSLGSGCGRKWKMSGKETARFPGTLVIDGNVQIVVEVIERLSRGFRLRHRSCKNQYSCDHSPSCPFQCSPECLYSKWLCWNIGIVLPFLSYAKLMSRQLIMVMMILKSLESLFLPFTVPSRYKIPKVLPFFFHLPVDQASDLIVWDV